MKEGENNDHPRKAGSDAANPEAQRAAHPGMEEDHSPAQVDQQKDGSVCIDQSHGTVCTSSLWSNPRLNVRVSEPRILYHTTTDNARKDNRQ